MSNNSEKRGAYTQEGIRSLIKSGRIKTLKNFKDSHVSVASLDITVEDEAYEIDRLFKPLAQSKEKIRDILPLMSPKPIKIGDIMYPGKMYLAKASVDLNFSPGLYMYSNAKSSSGRNFLLVRIVADGIAMFDGVNTGSGYEGELWLTFEPLAYPVILTDKETYSQIRILDKDTRMDKLDMESLLAKNDILFRRQNLQAYSQDSLALLSEDGAVITTIYAKANSFVGYKVKENINKAVDLSRRDIDSKDYFEKVYAKALSPDSSDGYIELEQHQKYLLCTNEALKIPETVCSELKALDPRLGLFFSHFAGFFDPGFFGTGTLEIIPIHNMSIRTKDPVAKFYFEFLKDVTVSYGDHAANYQGQIETKLPKQFKDFD